MNLVVPLYSTPSVGWPCSWGCKASFSWSVIAPLPWSSRRSFCSYVDARGGLISAVIDQQSVCVFYPLSSSELREPLCNYVIWHFVAELLSFLNASTFNNTLTADRGKSRREEISQTDLLWLWLLLQNRAGVQWLFVICTNRCRFIKYWCSFLFKQYFG